MNRRLPIPPLYILSAILAAATPPAIAATASHSSLTPAQRIARIQSRLGRLEHRETLLQLKGKTQHLAKGLAEIGSGGTAGSGAQSDGADAAHHRHRVVDTLALLVAVALAIGSCARALAMFLVIRLSVVTSFVI